MVAALALFAFTSGGDAPVAHAQRITESPNARWEKVRTVLWNDADVAIANTTATLTLTPLQIGGASGANILIHETLVYERIQMAGNAGTLVADIGKSGSLEIYAKDVSLKAASGTKTLGSGTTSVKPRIIEANGLPVVITLVSGSGNLSTLTSGAVDVWMLISRTPRLL